MNAIQRQLSPWVIAAAVLVTVSAAFAHGDSAPRHGGIVRSANDLSFELVTRDDGATLYIVDHDKPLPTAGFGGKLSVLLAGVKSDAPLKATGADALVATGLRFAPGAKVVAVVTTPQNQTLAVRFTLR